MKWTSIVVALLLIIALPSCNDSSSSPSPPTTTQPQATAYSIAVFVQTPRGNAVPFASLRVISGSRTGEEFTAGADGRITITNASGDMRFLATSDLCTNDRQTATPPTSGDTTNLTLTIQTGSLWRRSGTGEQHLDMPRCVDRVRITGRYAGPYAGFRVEIWEISVVNELLGTVSGKLTYDVVHETHGGPVSISGSSGSDAVAWALEQIR